MKIKTPIKKLTIELAKERVDIIKESINDPEVAHSNEDHLREWFIDCISRGMYLYEDGELIEIAKIILSTNDLSFPRWCA